MADLEKVLDASLPLTAKFDADGNLIVNTYQDVEKHLKYASDCRRVDREDRGAFGKRGDMRRTMSLPMNVINMICMQYGLDFYNPEHAKRIVDIAKRDYPAFKTTIDKRI